MTEQPNSRVLRADARRNREELLEAGRAMVVTHGADFPFEEVARSAGVGKGTLYRHFPTRDHLLAALLRERFDELTASAQAALSEEDAWAALAGWLADFDRMPHGLRGLGTRLGQAIGDEASAVSQACVPMKSAFAAILARAQGEGLIRADVEPLGVLSVVASLPEVYRDETGSSQYLGVIIDGLRGVSSR
jgi:AcrR family transcriptional regulator